MKPDQEEKATIPPKEAGGKASSSKPKEEQQEAKCNDSDAESASFEVLDGKKKPKKDGEPGPHDVLLGRGLGTYTHVGNVNFRKLVNQHKLRYVACCKVDKPKIARELVAYWRKLDPPGRFLDRNEPQKKGDSSNPADSEWHEIGDKKAQEKASQCLRERTPDVLPYYQYIRATKNKRKSRATGGAASASQVPTADVAALILQKQRADQQAMGAAQSMMLAPPPAIPSTLGSAPAPMIIQQQNPMQQRFAGAGQDAQAMVPLELLLQREQELKDKELEAHILRNRLSAAAPPVVTVVPAGAVLQPMYPPAVAPFGAAGRYSYPGAPQLVRVPAPAPALPRYMGGQAPVIVYTNDLSRLGTMR